MGWVVNATPRPLYPWERHKYPHYRGLDRSGRVRKISSSLLFDPRTAQPVASRYAVYGYKFEVVKDKLIREWCGLWNTLS